MRAEPEYDCQSCGACCVQTGPCDGNAYVYLDKSEARQMRSLGLRVVATAFGAECLGAARRGGPGGRAACVAFEGELGSECRCTVYADRPSVCREFEAGEDLCREARVRAGLPI